ncbi:hypothetical protein OPV22_003850 [Ensete ventricosum]|uniref:Uncharacterized protein n=1 Tax=Ensete ventricosum TaxID=4639 RepID=A0AAV8S213_ENSVE|nr:hypothetical protein OPV22_003850 [Ensete ventricosum]
MEELSDVEKKDDGKPRAKNSILDHFAPFGPASPPRLSSRRLECSSAATIGLWIFINSSWLFLFPVLEIR